MRSRVARACARVSAVLVPVLCGGTATAYAADGQALPEPQSGPLEALGGPVGLTAVVLGVIGMVVGAFRRKKAPTQPANERRG